MTTESDECKCCNNKDGKQDKEKRGFFSSFLNNQGNTTSRAGSIMGTASKFIVPIFMVFFIFNISKNTSDKNNIVVKSESYKSFIINNGKSDYNLDNMGIKTDVKSKGEKSIALIDFNSRNINGEFDRFSSKIDHIIVNKNAFNGVIIRIYSTGGSVIDYGSAMSQIKRLKNAGLKVTATIDEVAASGGYLMAVVADEIYANDFAFVGSIGVVANIPNLKKLLDKYGIEYNEYTAGESKRTVTPFKDPTEEDVSKLNESLVKVHDQFKKIVTESRSVDVNKVFNGDIFYGDEAINLGLIDGIKSSGDLIFENINNGTEIYHITATGTKKVQDNVVKVTYSQGLINTAIDRILYEINKDFYF